MHPIEFVQFDTYYVILHLKASFVSRVLRTKQSSHKPFDVSERIISAKHEQYISDNKSKNKHRDEQLRDPRTETQDAFLPLQQSNKGSYITVNEDNCRSNRKRAEDKGIHEIKSHKIPYRACDSAKRTVESEQTHKKTYALIRSCPVPHIITVKRKNSKRQKDKKVYRHKRRDIPLAFTTYAPLDFKPIRFAAIVIFQPSASLHSHTSATPLAIGSFLFCNNFLFLLSYFFLSFPVTTPTHLT